MAYVGGTSPKNFLLASLAVIFVPPTLKIVAPPLDTQTATKTLPFRRRQKKKSDELEQVRKVLSTRKAPACLLTPLYPYGKPRLCINIHHYAPPIGSTAQHAADSSAYRAATSLAAAGRCGVSEGSMSGFKSIT